MNQEDQTQTEDAVIDPSYSLTKEDAFQLVKLMIERRYFHDDDKGSTKFSTKCHLILTTDGKGYRTRDNLIVQWYELLQSNKGRTSRSLVSETLHVTISDLNMNQFSNQYPEYTILLVEEDFILIPLYWESMLPTIIQSAVDHDGCQLISDLAKFLALPTSILLQYFPLDTINTLPKEHITNTSSRSSSSCLISSSNQKVSLFLYHISSLSPCIVTDGWIEREISRLHDVCLACDAPTAFSVLGLDPTRHGAIMLDHGEIHGNLYVPTKYTIEQRRQQLELWKAQGFIFVPTTNSIGWEALRSSIITQNPTAIVLKQVILDPDRYVTPLIPLMQLATNENSFANLRTFLPDGIDESDAMAVLRDIAFPQLTSKDTGEIFIIQGEIFFISNSMIRHINRKILPPLIDAFARSVAKTMNSQSEYSKKVKAPKRNPKDLNYKAEESVSDRLLPLSSVISAVQNAYPDLAEITFPATVDSGDPSLAWEVENEGSISAMSNDNPFGPLPELCRRIVYSDSFCSNCYRAIENELHRLSRVVRSEGDTAENSSVESSWETTFPQACHQLSLHYKYVISVGSIKTVPSVDIEKIQCDFLRSNATSFAARIIQYSLYQKGLENQIVCFTTNEVDLDIHEGNTNEEFNENCETLLTSAFSPSALYNQSIPKAQRRFPKVNLKLVNSTDIDENPISVGQLTTAFKEFMSPGLSKILAQMWALCSSDSEHVEGSEDALSHTITESSKTEDTIREFMAFVEEHCLSICGIPFSKWNKKSEKQYLAARKTEMTVALEETSNPRHILEWTVMILCQQLRNWVVSGPHLSGPILRILCQEKKLPTPVSELLHELSQQIDKENCDMELVARVKSCGLCRDISKWTMES